MRILIALLVLCGGADGASAAAKAARHFYYDAGPETVDIFSYPKAQQGNYAVFAHSCSQCHTLARPINSPYITRGDWSRYVSAMHVKAKARGGPSFSPDEAKLIIDFLVYDAKIRKVEHKAAFAVLTKDLKKKFDAPPAARAP
ncbi:MAG: hypothetical protein ACHQ51_03420 [Elusimicrobiota bacterium]